MSEFEERTVSGSGVQYFGAKQKHPRLKEYNGKKVLVSATLDENKKTVIVCMYRQHGKEQLICAMSQR
ncbi:hypothetical protein [Sulfuricurvum sp.]|uniref:hypothetical protein n=1 Tax=Sulfuricurvum sp. TaxID=2025608 RepID=UPI00261ABE84|nr:hypothetical protein [Sulfuricurvum sp.]MDD2267034.1 hypothetical protein [Sulfuricurvum sp.]MDD2785073.1 hypothetical protein [Sulfuricurvum sp.]